MALKHPFGGNTMKQLISNIVKARYAPPPPIYSRPLMDLVGFLLQKNPASRPSINQLLRFPFIQQHIGRFLSSHKIQEEFSHTVLHGAAGAALLAGARAAAGGPRLPAKSAAEAHQKAQRLAAQQEAERAREAAREAAHAQHQQQQQQQQQAQLQAAAQAKAAAIARAKQQAVEQAERARRAGVEQMRLQAEAQAAQRAKAAQVAEGRARAAKEAMLREREKQAARDAANRLEAQRRADERAKLEAREREQMRELRAERERDRLEAQARHAQEHGGAGGQPAVVLRRGGGGGSAAPQRPSPSRPPWVGVGAEPADDNNNAAAAAPSSGHDSAREQYERERREREQREREYRERERERQRLAHMQLQQQQQQQYHGRQHHGSGSGGGGGGVIDPLAPTMVRPMQHLREHGREVRNPHEPPSYGRDPRGGQDSYNQHHQRGPSQLRPEHARHHAAPSPQPVQQHHPSPSADPNSRASKAAAQKLYEEQLAAARKANFEERKRLDAMHKQRLAGGGGGGGSSAVPAANEPPASRDERPVGGGGGNGAGAGGGAVLLSKRQQSMDGSPSDRGEQSERPTRQQLQQQQRVAAPALPAFHAAADGGAGGAGEAPSSYRRGERVGRAREAAMKAKEDELARLRIEYFEERKQLAARKQAQLEEAGLVPRKQQQQQQQPSKPGGLLPSEGAAPVEVAPVASSSNVGGKSSYKSSRADQLAQDRAEYFRQQRHKQAAAANSSPDATSLVVDTEAFSSVEEIVPAGVVSSAPVGVESEVVAAALAAQEAEECIDELASNTASAHDMVNLLATMRDVLSSAGTPKNSSAGAGAKHAAGDADGGDEDGDDLPVEVEEEPDYLPPVAGGSSGEDEEEEEGEEGKEDEYDAEEGGTSGTLNAEAEDEGEDENEDEEDCGPANEDESRVQEEFEGFRQSGLLGSTAPIAADDGDDDEQEEEETSSLSPPPPAAGEDHVPDLPAQGPRGGASRAAPLSQSALYNASATISPSQHVPVVASSASDASAAAAVSPAGSSSVVVAASGAAASPSASASSASGSISPSGESSSYKLEALRQFLSERLGDELLLDIYRLLRRSLQNYYNTPGTNPPIISTIHTPVADSSSAQASPNVTGMLPQSQQQQQPVSARRASISSLVIGQLNIRELLYGSGLLSGANTKYISLIQQLIKAEQELYGQL
jgi:hypothetical protein